MGLNPKPAHAGRRRRGRTSKEEGEKGGGTSWCVLGWGSESLRNLVFVGFKVEGRGVQSVKVEDDLGV